MLQDNEIQTGIRLCTAAANNERQNKVAIYTHGKGIEIFPDTFQTDRNYYHGEGGRKEFFTPICHSLPNGHVTLL